MFNLSAIPCSYTECFDCFGLYLKLIALARRVFFYCSEGTSDLPVKEAIEKVSLL